MRVLDYSSVRRGGETGGMRNFAARCCTGWEEGSERERERERDVRKVEVRNPNIRPHARRA